MERCIFFFLDPFSFPFKLINWRALTPAKTDLFSNALDILTNPDIVTLKKKGNILGRNPLPILLFTYDSLKIKFAIPFLKSWQATIPSKKDDTWSGHQNCLWEERQRKKTRLSPVTFIRNSENSPSKHVVRIKANQRHNALERSWNSRIG